MVYAIKWIHCAHQYHRIFRNTTCLMQWHMHFSFYKAITDCKFHRAVEKNSHLYFGVAKKQCWLTKTETHGWQVFALRWSRILDKTSQSGENPNTAQCGIMTFPLPFALSKIVSTKFHGSNEKHGSRTHCDVHTCGTWACHCSIKHRCDCGSATPRPTQSAISLRLLPLCCCCF